jgi:hypothetical protein
MGDIVDELFAFITTGDTGDEGVIAVELVGSDTAWPLVAATLERVHQMIPFAEAIREQTGHEYKLKHFRLLGEVSDEYLAQFSEPPAPADADDDQGPPGDDQHAPDDSRKGNGSGEDIS